MSVFLICILPLFKVWPLEFAVLALNIVLVLSILTTCLTYITIRAHLKRSPQIFNSDHGQERQNVERNIKLSKTVFLVIALSFACWVPAVIFYVIRDVFCKECIPAEVVLVGSVLHFANSLVNPITYTCRLSVFKKTLNRLLKRRQVPVKITKLWKKNVPCLAWPKKLPSFGPDVWHALIVGSPNNNDCDGNSTQIMKSLCFNFIALIWSHLIRKMLAIFFWSWILTRF